MTGAFVGSSGWPLGQSLLSALAAVIFLLAWFLGWVVDFGLVIGLGF